MDIETTLTLLGLIAGLVGLAGILKEKESEPEQALVPVPVPVEEDPQPRR